MNRSGLPERYAQLRNKPRRWLSLAAGEAAEILVGIGLLLGLALVSLALWIAIQAVGAVGWS